MKDFSIKIIKSLFISGVAVILVTVGIDAADHYDNFSESIIGRVVFGESEGPCPSDMTFVPTDNGGFCIDKYEASPSPECPYSNVTTQSDTKTNIGFPDCKAESKSDAIPWRYISQSQAIAACAKAGKRLPTNQEWYMASLGTPDLSSGWAGNDCQVSNNWKNQPGLTGSGESCVSSFGAYDMIGNIWEWVLGESKDGVYNDLLLPESGYVTSVNVEGIPINTSDLESDSNFNDDYFWIKDKETRGIARGGYWDNKSDAGIYSLYLVSQPSFAGTGIGFRCAK